MFTNVCKKVWPVYLEERLNVPAIQCPRQTWSSVGSRGWVVCFDPLDPAPADAVYYILLSMSVNNSNVIIYTSISLNFNFKGKAILITFESLKDLDGHLGKVL